MQTLTSGRTVHHTPIRDRRMITELSSLLQVGRALLRMSPEDGHEPLLDDLVLLPPMLLGADSVPDF